MRSCYSTAMIFDQEGTISADITWYFADDNAQFFPQPHLFGSSNWNTTGFVDLGPGEDWQANRTYTKGAKPDGLNGQGKFCGLPDWWTNGVPMGTPPVQLDFRGLPVCCAIAVVDNGVLPVGARMLQNQCQSWNLHLTPVRTLKTLPTMAAWTTTFTSAIENQWKDPIAGVDIMSAVGTLGSCLGYGATTMTLRVNSTLPNRTLAVTLLSYDSATRTGLWQITDSQPQYNKVQVLLTVPV